MKKCLFCEQTTLTREHVWPDWIVELIKTIVPPTSRRKRGFYTATHAMPDGSQRQFPTGSIERKERIVCGSCNNEWMNDIETCTIPVLRPLILGDKQDRVFDVQDLCTLAAWITLRSMVFDALVPPADRYYSDADRTAFAESRYLEPSPNTHIWLAFYGGEPFSAKFHIASQIVSKADRIHVLTAMVHRIAFKFITWEGSRVIRSAEIAKWGLATRRIWPYRGRIIDWPPAQGLTRQGLKPFRDWFLPPNRRDIIF